MITYKFLTPHDIGNFMSIDLWNYSKASFSCKMLYVFLSKRCYENKSEYLTLRNKEIASAIGINARTVQRLIRELTDLGYIKTKIIFKGNTKEVLERRIYVNVVVPRHVK